MRPRTVLASLIVLMAGACLVHADRPAPPSSPDATALDAGPTAGFGEESYRLVNEKDEIVSVLKNGAVVIARRIASPVVAVRGVAQTGGIYEKQWLGGGLSHLLEHLVAGGSCERRTEAQNRDLLQKIGNNSNAFTTEDNTCFFVNTTPEHVEQAVDLVTGWMLGAKITPDEYKREYQVVQRELEMGQGEPDRQFYYLTAMNRYRVSPARVPVIGYQPVIQRLSRDDVYTYYKMAYQPNNMIFCVAGNLEPAAMLAAVRKHVDDAPPGRVFSHNIEPEPPVLTPRIQAATFPRLGQARVMLGFPGVSLNGPDMYALDVLATILGGGDSSTMVQELRDKQEIVSGVSVSDDTPPYASGTFGIEFTADPDRVPRAMTEIFKLLDEVKKNGVDAERLKRAKTQMHAERVKKYLTAEDTAAALADDFRTTGDIHFSDAYVERTDRVTAEQIQEVAKKYFTKSRLLTTALFPAEWAGAQGLPKIEDLLRPAHSDDRTSSPDRENVATAGVVREVLPNGVVLLVKRVTSSPMIVINLYSLGGVSMEDASTNGLGNLTMQLLVRGTTTHPGDKIAEFLDSTGGELQTACNTNTWSWSATCLKDQFAPTLELFADVVHHPAFAQEELDPLKKRIKAQIDNEEATWKSAAIRYFKEQYFGPSHSPYQFSVDGSARNVEGFTLPQARDWYEKKVMASRKVLAIYGDVDVNQARAAAMKSLGQGSAPAAIPTNENNASAPSANPAVAEPAPGDRPATADGPAWVTVDRVEVNKTDQNGIAGVVIGFDADTYVGEKSYYDIVMAKTLTGGFAYPTGYLFETLRGKGLVYDVETQNIAGLDKKLPGTFMVFGGCDPKNVNEVVELCLQNVARLQGKEDDLDPNWYTRAKDLIVVGDAMEHETPEAQASSDALDELYGLGFNWHQQFAAKIKQAPMSAVQAFARARLRHCVVTVSTPAPQAVTIKTGGRTYNEFPPVDLTPRGVQHDTGGPGK